MINKTGMAEVVKELANRLAAQYADDPNILGVGWGRARRGGKLTSELCLVFFVKEKLDEDGCKARGTAIIPKRYEDVPTDVIVRGRIERAQMAGSRNDTLYDPLRGGVATANLEQMDRTFFWSEGGVGTLGMLCRDGDGRDLALSNWHVWADDGAANGDRIVQPGTPDGGGYAEGVAKAVLCGPFLGSFMEGRVPSGLAAGLYAGAAGAATLAALSDEIDPFRRGQDATPAVEKAVTHKESLSVKLAYEEALPWPGRPFESQVSWRYTRHTNLGLMKADADEAKKNPQVLRGYAVTVDRAAYEAGDTIVVSAAIWDPQQRPADAYHVVAHLVSAADPSHHLRLVLHPARCRGLNLVPPSKREREIPRPIRRGKEGKVCVEFGFYAVDQVFERAYNFGPVASAYFAGDAPLRMAELPEGSGAGLHVPEKGVIFRHAPAERVVVRLAHSSEAPVRVTAFDAFERRQSDAIAPGQRDRVHEIALKGEMITHVRVEGGGNTAVVVGYCFAPVRIAERGEGAVVEVEGIESLTAARRSLSPLVETAALGVAPVLSVGRLNCERFAQFPTTMVFPAEHQFGSIKITALDKKRQRIVDWPQQEPNSLLFSDEGIRVEHAAAKRIVLRIGHFTGKDVLIRALDDAGNLQMEVTKTSANVVETIELSGANITSVEITGGGHEAILVHYCLDESGAGKEDGTFVHCFRGAMPLPPNAPGGRWIVYLAVQNVNHVPTGVPPEQAATVIGGHVMSPTAELLGCGFMLLGDHVFDIF